MAEANDNEWVQGHADEVVNSATWHARQEYESLLAQLYREYSENGYTSDAILKKSSRAYRHFLQTLAGTIGS